MTGVNEEDREIISYIGFKRYSLLVSSTPEEREVMVKANVPLEGTILVEGSEDMLRKFKAYFLVRCSEIRPAYIESSVQEFVDAKMDREKDSFSSLGNRLAFIYCHREMFGTSKAEAWMETSLLYEAVERNRAGKITVILTERSLPIIQRSDEVLYLDLVTPFKKKKLLTKIEAPTDSNSSTTSNDSAQGPSYDCFS